MYTYEQKIENHFRFDLAFTTHCDKLRQTLKDYDNFLEHLKIQGVKPTLPILIKWRENYENGNNKNNMELCTL